MLVIVQSESNVSWTKLIFTSKKSEISFIYDDPEPLVSSSITRSFSEAERLMMLFISSKLFYVCSVFSLSAIAKSNQTLCE